MTHAKRRSANPRLSAAEWAAVLVRGVRANLPPSDWPAQIALLAERMSDMADARQGDAALCRQRQLAAAARRDAAILEAVAAELERQAIRLQSGDGE